jgi:hypothetical protein
MLRILFLSLVIGMTFWFTACKPHQKPAIFSTSLGDIEKDASMAEVMDLFGNPSRITTGDSTESWYYRVKGQEKVAIDFLEGKVVGVRERVK